MRSKSQRSNANSFETLSLCVCASLPGFAKLTVNYSENQKKIGEYFEIAFFAINNGCIGTKYKT